eukprot:12340560-Alexandrium_andersonii.AAC.1
MLEHSFTLPSVIQFPILMPHSSLKHLARRSTTSPLSLKAPTRFSHVLPMRRLDRYPEILRSGEVTQRYRCLLYTSDAADDM